MRRPVSAALLALLLTLAATAGPQTPAKDGGVRCTLTNKKLDKCCCEQREGKLYCPLAKKTIEKCCCEAAKQAAKKAPKS